VKEVPTKITCPRPDCGQTFEVLCDRRILARIARSGSTDVQHP